MNAKLLEDEVVQAKQRGKLKAAQEKHRLKDEKQLGGNELCAAGLFFDCLCLVFPLQLLLLLLLLLLLSPCEFDI